MAIILNVDSQQVHQQDFTELLEIEIWDMPVLLRIAPMHENCKFLRFHPDHQGRMGEGHGGRGVG